jgi:hypothetical protein
MIDSRTSSYFDENQYSSVSTVTQYHITGILGDTSNIVSVVLPQKVYRVIAGRLFAVEPGSPPILNC